MLCARLVRPSVRLPLIREARPRLFAESTAPSSIFVGNLSYSSSEEDLRRHFSAYGEIKSIKIPTDRATGRQKGFGFVNFSSSADATKACELNEKDFLGRKLYFSLSKPKTGGSPVDE